MLERARDREGAYERWAVGTPYANAETYTTRLRFNRSLGLPGRRVLRHLPASAGRPAFGPGALTGLAAAAAGLGALGLVAGPDGVLVGAGLGAAVGGLVWGARTLGSAVRRAGPSDALEDLAAAVATALAETGGIAPALDAAAVRVAAEQDGYYRCYLAGASAEDSRRFAEALDEVLAPLAAPRYIIPRYVADAPDSTLAAAGLWLRLTLRGGVGARVVYHAVPSYLAANRRRVGAFARAWRRHVNPGEPLYCEDPRAHAILAVQRGVDPFAVTSQIRALWR